MLVRQIGESPPIGAPTRRELLRGDQNHRDEACGDQVEAHDQGCRHQEFLGVADAAGCSGSSSGSPRTSGITLTPSRSQRCQELA
jgi:hypothetical protein